MGNVLVSLMGKQLSPGFGAVVTVKKSGHILETVFCSKRASGCPIVNLDKSRYLIKSTGEVRTKIHREKRIDNIRSIKQSHAKLRDLINANTAEPERCRWVTMTYAENMTDHKRLYADFEKFIKRLRYRFGSFEYIMAPEPQGRGAWHTHIILIFPDKAPFIANDELAKIWGFGFTKIRKLDDLDNIGAYLTAYLQNLPAPEKQGKKYLKGARMALYPAGMNLYRASRGVQRPEVFRTSEADLAALIADCPMTYRLTLKVRSGSFGFYVVKRCYNLKRRFSREEKLRLLYGDYGHRRRTSKTESEAGPAGRLLLSGS